MSHSRGGGRGPGPGAGNAWAPRHRGSHTQQRSMQLRVSEQAGQTGQQRRRLGMATTWPHARPGHSGPPQQASWFIGLPPTFLPSLIWLLSIWAPVPPAHGAVDEGVCGPTCQQRQVTPRWFCPLRSGWRTGLTAGHPGPRSTVCSSGPSAPSIPQLLPFPCRCQILHLECRFDLAPPAAAADVVPGQNAIVSSFYVLNCQAALCTKGLHQ